MAQPETAVSLTTSNAPVRGAADAGKAGAAAKHTAKKAPVIKFFTFANNLKMISSLSVFIYNQKTEIE